MSDAYIVRRGGGANLNYKVVNGTSQPTSPTNNTIWVNTSTAIHDHVFSATEPHRVSKNKNLIVYPYITPSRTINGITMTVNSDGSVTFSGTATVESYFVFSQKDASAMYLQPGTYTASGLSGGSNNTYYAGVSVSSDNWKTETGYGLVSSTTRTFTLSVPALARAYIVIRSGTTVSFTAKIQLEKGSTATSFVKGDATGQVWFMTDTTTSDISFNALKKNAFMLYPVLCKQYISGAWKMMDANIFPAGSWVNLWNGIFHDNGVLFTEYAKQESNGTVTINTDAILLTTQKSVDSKAYMRLGKIRIDGISSISADFTVVDTVNGSHYCYLFVAQETGVTYAGASIKASTNPGASASSTTTLDLSSAGLTGDYYVYVGTEAANWANARKINIKKVYATR